MSKEGCFVISLDFELVWGVFDNYSYKENKHYFHNTLYTIPKVLKLFQEYEMHATWATVGMLFNKDWNEWDENIPSFTPEYTNKRLSAYKFGKSIQNHGYEEFCFAPQIINLIKDTPFQEVGTHTYSHYYCLEKGQGIKDFKKDLAQAIALAKKYDINLNSLVFPRNQLKHEYLKICMDMGISSVRSNPTSWYWKDAQSTSILTRLARSGDAYLPLGRKSYTNDYLKDHNSPLLQKASRFFRPVESNVILRKLKLRRIMNEMTTAARSGKVYHLWWHPHNFGNNPVESMNDLNLILDHFKILKEQYSFESLNMHEYNLKVRSR